MVKLELKGIVLSSCAPHRFKIIAIRADAACPSENSMARATYFQSFALIMAPV